MFALLAGWHAVCPLRFYAGLRRSTPLRTPLEPATSEIQNSARRLVHLGRGPLRRMFRPETGPGPTAPRPNNTGPFGPAAAAAPLSGSVNEKFPT